MTNHEIELTINASEHELQVESRTLLIHAIRDELGYTGTNIGCESGKCGACTIQMNGDAIKSCMVLAAQADGAEIETVENLATDGEYHPIQEGFHEEHGLQCGYCTPGMMMTATDILGDNPDPSEEEIRKGLKGNICRCTGYQNIVEAVQTAANEMSGTDTPAESD